MATQTYSLKTIDRLINPNAEVEAEKIIAKVAVWGREKPFYFSFKTIEELDHFENVVRANCVLTVEV